MGKGRSGWGRRECGMEERSSAMEKGWSTGKEEGAPGWRRGLRKGTEGKGGTERERRGGDGAGGGDGRRSAVRPEGRRAGGGGERKVNSPP